MNFTERLMELVTTAPFQYPDSATFQTTIGPFASEQTIQYRIVAEDQAGNVVTTPLKEASKGDDEASPPPDVVEEPALVDFMALQAGQRWVVPGAMVNVPVWLVNGTDIANINFNVTYDPAVVVPEAYSS